MGEKQDNANRYRKHAAQLRIMAEAETDSEQRLRLLQSAYDYERMAQTIEKAAQLK
jgi:hypothetical protein